MYFEYSDSQLWYSKSSVRSFCTAFSTYKAAYITNGVSVLYCLFVTLLLQFILKELVISD